MEGDVVDFFANSQWLDYQVTRPLAHVRSNWELSWDPSAGLYAPEGDSFAEHLNALVDELDACNPPAKYHDNEDRLAEHARSTLGWDIRQRGQRWVRGDGSPLSRDSYFSVLEQGDFRDAWQRDLLHAAAGRVRAAIIRQQTHFDEMEESHAVVLAGVLSIILYHRS